MNKISIALCTCNGANFLPAQLESFLIQTHLPDELIICDDCSFDETLQIIENFSQKAPFSVKVFHNEQNLGIIKNFEKAVSLCSGEIIFLSDQDDVWLPEKIALTLQEFDKSAETGMVFSNAELVDENLKSLGLYSSNLTFTKEIRRLDNSEKFLEEFLKRNYITGATLAFRAHFREKLFPFPNDIPEMLHDGWIAFIIYISAKYSYIDKPFVKYRQHSHQHLGLTNENPLKDLDGNAIFSQLAQTRKTEYKRIEGILRELENRPKLSKELKQIEPTVSKVMAELLEIIEHLNYRSTLPNNPLRRLKAIIPEILSGRYRRHSKGIVSAARDFIRIRNLSDIKKIFSKLNGINRKFRQRKQRKISENLYQKWIKETARIETEKRLEVLKQVNNSAYKPLISVVMPVYNVDEKWLRSAIESVLAQSYSNWELCIADDNSSVSHIKPVLDGYSKLDSRIKVVFCRENGHISAASNSALEMAKGDYVALLDNDDELAPDALLYVAKGIQNDSNLALIYSDEDKIDKNNNRFDAAFKPDWSRDLFYSLNLVTHLAIFRRDILMKIKGFRQGVEGSQDYDLVLRFIEQIEESQIKHIPRILYHWRAIKSSVALDSNQKSYAHDAARESLRAHFKRLGISAQVVKGFAEYHRVIYDLPNPAPKVSIIIENEKPDKIFKKTLNALLKNTDYENFDILIGTNDQNTQSFIENINFSDISKVKFFNLKIEENLRAKRLNEIVRYANGEILVFIAANCIPLNKDWLRELASQANRPEIGAAGGKILYKNNTVRSAGYIFGVDGICGRAHQFFPREAAGNFARLQVVNNFSAVSAECLAVKRADYLSIEGFDSENFPRDLFDADFCLRLETIKKRNLLTPYAELRQISSFKEKELSRQEIKNFSLRWQKKIENDPFYNPNLTRKDESFQVELPPRII